MHTITITTNQGTNIIIKFAEVSFINKEKVIFYVDETRFEVSLTNGTSIQIERG